MQQRIKTYWGRDGLGWLKAVGVSAVAAAALGVAVSGDRGMQLASLTALDGSASQVSPQLKVFVLDSKTDDMLRTQEPTLNQWMAMINAIAVQQPNAIIFEDVFDWQRQPRFFNSFNRFMTQLKSETDVRVYASGQPDPAIRDVFHQIGHAKGQWLVPARMSETPHVALFATDSYQIKDGEVRVNDQVLATDAQGHLWAPPLQRTALQPQVHSLSQAFHANVNEVPLGAVKPGDTVVVLHRDSVPEKSATVVLTNGILNSQLTSYVGSQWWGMALACLLGGLVTWRLRRWPLAGAALAGLAIIAAYGFTAATVWSQATWWAAMAVGYLSTMTICVAVRSRRVTSHMERIRAAFGTRAPEQAMATIASLEKPTTLEATVMVIEVSGFALLKKMEEVDAGYTTMGDLYKTLRETVVSRGGVVAKIYNDEVMCIFGLAGDQPVVAAAAAMQAAVEIQDRFTVHNSKMLESGGVVCPAKIGVQTGPVTVGLLETSSMTIAGQTVQQAMRLKKACQPQHVMISAETITSWTTAGYALDGWTEKLLQSENESAYYSVYELDPYFSDRDAYVSTQRAFLDASGIKRRDQRNDVEQLDIQIISDIAEGHLVDFSDSGLGISLGRCIAPGERIDFQLCSKDKGLDQLLAERGLKDLVGEVKWGRKKADGYIHGIDLRGLPRSQRSALMEILSGQMQGEMLVSA